jgi:hypothetical protein
MEARKKEINLLLHKIYTDKASPGGFAGHNALYKEAIKEDNAIKHADVTEFLQGQRTYGLFKPRKLRFPRSKTFASGLFTDTQADLAGF